MRLVRLFQLVLIFLTFSINMQSTFAGQKIPEGFVKLSDIAPDIIQNKRYASAENFLGRKVPGYHQSSIYCTRQAALALNKVNAALKEKGYALVVYDAYRPQRAVNAFLAWSKSKDDQLGKALYYPSLPKQTLFALGYLIEKSGHSRGSTIDLTLIELGKSLKPIHAQTRKLNNDEKIPYLDDNTVDMGSSFDLFHPVSHFNSSLITPEQQRHRRLLNKIMKTHGFVGVAEEWWHYTLINEPYPDTYFDFTT
jgi:D-alanyl-D-alanine dipeptidase